MEFWSICKSGWSHRKAYYHQIIYSARSVLQEPGTRRSSVCAYTVRCTFQFTTKANCCLCDGAKYALSCLSWFETIFTAKTHELSGHSSRTSAGWLCIPVWHRLLLKKSLAMITVFDYFIKMTKWSFIRWKLYLLTDIFHNLLIS